MRQKTGSIQERGGWVETSGMNHPLRGEFAFHVRRDFKMVSRLSDLLLSQPFKIKTKDHP
jgi:hypothetical protein